jgi:ATP-dependent DNA ligase
VMKRADSTYQPGRRSKSWIKSVLRRRTAVVVCGFIFCEKLHHMQVEDAPLSGISCHAVA